MAITLTDVSDKRVIQRDSNNQGTITISGTYSGSPTSIEARIVENGTSTEVKTWTVIDNSPSGGSFSGDLSGINQGHWYNIQVRFSNDINDTDEGINRFGIGIIIATAGQSNFVTMFDNGTQNLTATDGVVVYNSSSQWVVPTFDGPITLGNTLISELSIPICFVDSAPGSAGLVEPYTYGRWLDTTEGTVYDNLKDLINETGGVVEFFMFGQGESDAIDPDMDPGEYKTGLQTFVPRIRTDFSGNGIIPKYLTQTIGRLTNGNSTDARWQGVKDDEISYANDDSQAYIVCDPTIDTLMPDGLHYYRDSELNDRCERMANCILSILGEQSEGFGPVIDSFEVTNATTIDVNILHNGGTDFTPTTGITGFEIFDNGSQETISSAIRLSGNKIRLTVSGSLDGTITCRYLYGRTPNITAPVVDNTSILTPLRSANNIIQASSSPSSSISPSPSSSPSPSESSSQSPSSSESLSQSPSSSESPSQSSSISASPSASCSDSFCYTEWDNRKKNETNWTIIN